MTRFCALFSTVFLLTASAFAADWNQFRGPNHDNHSFSSGIAKQWGSGGPKLLWKINTLGIGFSNVSFSGESFYTLGDADGICSLSAYNKADGKKLWSLEIGNAGNPGGFVGPRSTPAVDDKYVYALGQYGDFVCADKTTGKEVWGGNFQEELGGKPQNIWGYASSPILDNGNVIVPIGGKDGTLIAFSKTGQRVWRSKEITDDAPYDSVVPVEIGGKKQYLLFTLAGVYGVDIQNGNKLWGVSRFKDKPVCSDPVYKDGVVFVSSEYEMGANGYQVTKDGTEFAAKEIYADKGLQNQHGGIVLVGDYAYFTTRRALVCIELKSGKIVWENRCVGKGSLTFADGLLIVRSETGDGEVALVEATPEKYIEKGRFSQPDRSDKNSWTYPVVVDGKLYLRDQNVLFCYEIQ